MNKFIPELASLCFAFRDILKKDADWKWTEKHEKAFKEVNEKVKKNTVLTHFKRQNKLRIICNAGKKGLGAALQQSEKKANCWKPIAYASRFLTSFEEKYSINELELLAVVWSVEHFTNYVYGTIFKIVLDHKALQSVLKSNRGNKTNSSRLTRWADRLLSYDFEVVLTPVRTLGMADYLSRHPSSYEGKSVKAEQLFNDWFTVNVVEEFEKGFENTTGKSQQPIKIEQTPKCDKSINRQWLTVERNKANNTVKRESNKLYKLHNKRNSSKMDEAKIT